MHYGLLKRNVSRSFYTGRGNVCCLFTRQKQAEDTPPHPASLITKPKFNVTCHVVNHEIIREAERHKKPLKSPVSHVSGDVTGG